jgi:hypothetical protein
MKKLLAICITCLSINAIAQTIIVTQPAPTPTCTVRGNVVYCF